MRLWKGLRSVRVKKEHQGPLMDFVRDLSDLPDVDGERIRLALGATSEKLAMNDRANFVKQALMDRQIIDAWTQATLRNN